MAKLVRINPCNPSQGYHARTYAEAGSEYGTFRVERGWYEVDDVTAERLKALRNNPNDVMSRPVFQVVTQSEASALEIAAKEKVRRADPSSPIPMPKGVEDADWDKDMGGDPEKDYPTEYLDSEEQSEPVEKEAPGTVTDDDLAQAFDTSPDLTSADVSHSPKHPQLKKKATKKARVSSRKATKKTRRKPVKTRAG